VASVAAADVERMEFQLALRRRGISDQAVLRAMDEVPREYFVAAEFTDSTGSGYQTAVLSRVAREVVSIERYRTLANLARGRLQTLGYNNVTILVGDGFVGAPERAPFDRILVTAAAAEVPPALLEQLGEAGKLVLPLGPRNGPQYIVKLSKTATGELARETLIGVRFVPLLPGQAREL
jgi:protein-L-isoaspartate(D-aspartate) O-methyltransferase